MYSSCIEIICWNIQIFIVFVSLFFHIQYSSASSPFSQPLSMYAKESYHFYSNFLILNAR